MANVSYINTTRADEAGDMPVFMAQPSGDSSMMNFRQVFSVIWRRKWIVVAIMLLIIVIAYSWLQSQTPLYSSSAEVVIGIREETVTGFQGVSTSQDQDFYFNETQAKIISSSQVAEEVANRLGLFEDPSALYWKDKSGQSVGGRLKSFVKSALPDPVVDGFRGILNLFRGGSQEVGDQSIMSRMTEAERAAHERQALILNLQNAISVDPSDRSRTITISAVSDRCGTRSFRIARLMLSTSRALSS